MRGDTRTPRAAPRGKEPGRHCEKHSRAARSSHRSRRLVIQQNLRPVRRRRGRFSYDLGDGRMCDFHNHAARLEPRPRTSTSSTRRSCATFVARVRAPIDAAAARADGVRVARARVRRSCSPTATGCPEEFQRDVPDSGMGGGIGQWLLYRSADRSLCLFSLVVPPGSKTPIHDHLAWGLIGLYRGNQDEEIYRPGDGTIELVAAAAARARRPLRAAAAGGRHPLRADDLRGDVGVDPPARERHRLRRAPHLRRARPARRGRSARATRTPSARATR